MNRLLIMGMGNMGSLHAKYAQGLGVDWAWYDPRDVKAPAERRRVESPDEELPYSHIIIATPASTHADILRSLGGFEGKILVEKPGVMHRDDLYLLDASNVSVGLVEHFNPAWETLEANVDPDKVLGIDFVRCSARPVSRIKESSFIDVGIHDLSLFLSIFKYSDIEVTSVFDNSNTFCLMVQLNTGQIARFIWSNETFHKEREVHVRQTDCNYTCNLIDQTVKRYSLSSDNQNTVRDLYVEKASPIRRELETFLDARQEPRDSVRAHELFFSVLDCLEA